MSPDNSIINHYCRQLMKIKGRLYCIVSESWDECRISAKAEKWSSEGTETLEHKLEVWNVGIIKVSMWDHPG